MNNMFSQEAKLDSVRDREIVVQYLPVCLLVVLVYDLLLLDSCKYPVGDGEIDNVSYGG